MSLPKHTGERFAVNSIEQAEEIQRGTEHKVMIEIDPFIDMHNLCPDCANLVGAKYKLIAVRLNGVDLTDIAGAKILLEKTHQLPQVKH